jgi:7-cyano-7-deazaguanine reductase
MTTYDSQSRKPRRAWSDRSLLGALKNPSQERYRIHLHCPEVTFIGKKEQPDFACIEIVMYPTDSVIELKSLKRYLFSFRERLMSYERLVNVLYDDLMATYCPSRLIVQVRMRARGGINSKLKVDSAWRAAREPSLALPASLPFATSAGIETPLYVMAGT